VIFTTTLKLWLCNSNIKNDKKRRCKSLFHNFNQNLQCFVLREKLRNYYINAEVQNQELKTIYFHKQHSSKTAKISFNVHHKYVVKV
jgi:histidyl-tRNA synthetase